MDPAFVNKFICSAYELHLKTNFDYKYVTEKFPTKTNIEYYFY